jgi:hypothetical protein
MDDQQQHEMILVEISESGEENWYCPTCGRRMIITWQPWKKVIVEQGDLYVAHSGGKGGLKMGPFQISQGDQTINYAQPRPTADDPYLAPWQRWLDSIDSDDLWNREL